MPWDSERSLKLQEFMNRSLTTVSSSPSPIASPAQEKDPSLENSPIKQQAPRAKTPGAALLSGVPRVGIKHLLATSQTRAHSSASASSTPSHKKARQPRSVSPPPPVKIAIEDLQVVSQFARLMDSVRTQDFQVNISSKNYWLKWIKKPELRSSLKWLNLDNMPTDHLKNGGSREDGLVMINSPRSTWVLLRNGLHPMDLQEICYPEVAKQLRIEGVKEHFIQQRFEFLQQKIESNRQLCLNQYRSVAAQMPLDEILTFFDMLDSTDSSHTPQIIHDSVTKQSFVAPPDDTHLRGTLQLAREKKAQDRVKLRRLLDVEIASRGRLMELHKDQMEKNMHAAANRREKTARRQEEKKQEATLRKLVGEEKSEKRIAAKLLADEQREAEMVRRQERARQSELESQIASRRRKEERAARREEKQNKMRARIERAITVIHEKEEERQKVLRKKEEARNALMERVQEEHAEKTRLRTIEIEQNVLRRKDILNRSEYLLFERRMKALDIHEQVEQRIAQFQEEKATLFEMRRVHELEKEVHREQVFAEAEAREQAVIATQLEREHKQQQRYERFKESIEESRRADAERAKQRWVNRTEFNARAATKREFNKLLLANALQHKSVKSEEAHRLHNELVDEARTERSRLNMYRTVRLRKTVEDQTKAERDTYFRVFRQEHGSDQLLSSKGLAKKRKSDSD